MREKFRILNMADITACPNLFDDLASIAEIVSLPADVSTLRERIGEFDAYLASLHVRADRSVLEQKAHHGSLSKRY